MIWSRRSVPYTISIYDASSPDGTSLPVKTVNNAYAGALDQVRSIHNTIYFTGTFASTWVWKSFDRTTLIEINSLTLPEKCAGMDNLKAAGSKLIAMGLNTYIKVYDYDATSTWLRTMSPPGFSFRAIAFISYSKYLLVRSAIDTRTNIYDSTSTV